MAKTGKTTKETTANLGFEAKLWLTVYKPSNNMDAAEYKHVVLDLIVLKYTSDTFGEHQYKLFFASADGKNGGQFYIPSFVVRWLVEKPTTYKGRIHVPACGFTREVAGFVELEEFAESYDCKRLDISNYDKEINVNTRYPAMTNFGLHGPEIDFCPQHADTFSPDFNPDYVLGRLNVLNQGSFGDVSDPQLYARN